MQQESAGNSLSKIRTAIRSHGLQKQLAYELGMSEAQLSKVIDSQLPMLIKLLSSVGLEIVEHGEVDDLRRVLKRYI